MSIALSINKDYAGTICDYEIYEEADGFRIWQSSGPLQGDYLDMDTFDTFDAALSALSTFISQGE